MDRTVYLDYAATTPVDERVLKAMVPFYKEHYGNPNSLYTLGRDAYRALEDARERVARSIGTGNPFEVIFTSGGTESDNTALIGLASGGGRSSGHIIVSAFEHHAVLDPARWLWKHGFELTELKPRSDGVIHPDDLKAAMREDTALVSIMHANNEIGTVQPVKELAEIAHAGGALMHTDAAQTLGKIDFDVEELGVDAASFSSHKIYGPKGFGALYLRTGTPMAPLIMGGGQESGRRSGTQNVAGAVGFATALEIMDAERPTETPRLTALRDRVIDGILNRIELSSLNAAEAQTRLPHIANFIIGAAEGESMMLHLDAKGIAVSTGSACSSGSLKPSHVLIAIGCPQEYAHGSLRVSVGRYTTQEDVDYFVDQLVPVTERIRSMSPLWDRTRSEHTGSGSSAGSSQLYSEKVMEHFNDPHNVGVIEDADGTGEMGDPGCGDVAKITIRVTDDRIENIKCQTFGCAAAIATSSVLTDMAMGMSLDEAASITKQDVADALDGLSPAKMHCSVMATGALKTAIDDYLVEDGREPITGPILSTDQDPDTQDS